MKPSDTCSTVLTCYPQPHKPKARAVCEAFAEGAAACGVPVAISHQIPARLEPGAAFFYGVRPAWAHLWQQAKAEGRTWFYADNSYFDRCRGTYFRVTKNALQHSGLGASEGLRAMALGLAPKPWRGELGIDGNELLVCRQSDEFMRTVAGYAGGVEAWQADVMPVLKRTGLPIRIRAKDTKTALADDLLTAYAVITHASAAAIEALLAGVLVHCTGDTPAVRFNTRLQQLDEGPYRPARREEMINVLADNQWTLDELRSGAAWRALNG